MASFRASDEEDDERGAGGISNPRPPHRARIVNHHFIVDVTSSAASC